MRPSRIDPCQPMHRHADTPLCFSFLQRFCTKSCCPVPALALHSDVENNRVELNTFSIPDSVMLRLFVKMPCVLASRRLRDLRALASPRSPPNISSTLVFWWCKFQARPRICSASTSFIYIYIFDLRYHPDCRQQLLAIPPHKVIMSFKFLLLERDVTARNVLEIKTPPFSPLFSTCFLGTRNSLGTSTIRNTLI